MKRKILLVGGGGHCHSILDSLFLLDRYDEIGIIDLSLKADSLMGVPVVGTDKDLPCLMAEGWRNAFVTVGSVGDTEIRRRLWQSLKQMGFHIPIIMDPSAVAAIGVTIGAGTFVGKRVVLNTGVRIGSCAIINTGALIEHDTWVDNFAHISPGTVLCGQVRVGEDSHVGAGSVVRQQISIGKKVLIGAGSVVVSDLENGVTAFGNPCRVVKR